MLYDYIYTTSVVNIRVFMCRMRERKKKEKDRQSEEFVNSWTVRRTFNDAINIFQHNNMVLLFLCVRCVWPLMLPLLKKFWVKLRLDIVSTCIEVLAPKPQLLSWIHETQYSMLCKKGKMICRYICRNGKLRKDVLT